jgi:DNA polymerase III sliding clamp (beta) subunit (PCNA family)
LSNAFIEIKADENTIITSDAEDTFKSKYSLEYLKKIINGSKISERVSIHFNTDYPLKVQYQIVDKIKLSFILAPRVDND